MPRFSAAAIVLAAAASLSAPAPAQAGCYADFGCTDRDRFDWRDLADLASCQSLWEMRNTIYFENGYCFSTTRGRNFFGNAGCRHRDAGRVPLNRSERANIEAIKRAERADRC